MKNPGDTFGDTFHILLRVNKKYVPSKILLVIGEIPWAPGTEVPDHPYTHPGLVYIDAKELKQFIAGLHAPTVSCCLLVSFQRTGCFGFPTVGICGELPAVQEDVGHGIEARDSSGRALSTGW